MTADPRVEAVRSVLASRLPGGNLPRLPDGMDSHTNIAAAAVAALDAYDETALRERIAGDIEAESERLFIAPNQVLLNGTMLWPDQRKMYAAQWTAAARIARGTT